MASTATTTTAWGASDHERWSPPSSWVAERYRFGHLDCDLCGRRLRSAGAAAEMYDPSRNHKSVVCHFGCGLAEGLEIVIAARLARLSRSPWWNPSAQHIAPAGRLAPHVRQDLRDHQRGRRPAGRRHGRRRRRVRLRPVAAPDRAAAGLRHHPPAAAGDPHRRRVPRRAPEAGHRAHPPGRRQGGAAPRQRIAGRSPRWPQRCGG